MLSMLRDERGQGLVEYGLIVGLIAMVAIGAFLLLGGTVSSRLDASAKSDPSGLLPILTPLR